MGSSHSRGDAGANDSPPDPPSSPSPPPPPSPPSPPPAAPQEQPEQPGANVLREELMQLLQHAFRGQDVRRYRPEFADQVRDAEKQAQEMIGLMRQFMNRAENIGKDAAASEFFDVFEPIAEFTAGAAALLGMQLGDMYSKCFMAFFMMAVTLDKPGDISAWSDYVIGFADQNGMERRVCGKVFERGDNIYCCENCSISPNAAVCEDCFMGNIEFHKDHNYLILEAGSAGGCCDCGDPLMFVREGCCRAHSGSQSDSADTAMDIENAIPPEVLTTFEMVLPSFNELLLRIISEHPRSPSTRCLIQGYGLLLKKASKPVQHYIGRNFIEYGILESLLVNYSKMLPETRASLHIMMPCLNWDLSFKKSFAQLYFKKYGTFENKSSAKHSNKLIPGHEEPQDEFSSVHSMMTHVCSSTEALTSVVSVSAYDITEVLFRALRDSVEGLRADTGKYPVRASLIDNTRFMDVITAIRYFTGPRTTCQAFFEKALTNGTMKIFMDVLRGFQYTIPVVRRETGDMVESVSKMEFLVGLEVSMRLTRLFSEICVNYIEDCVSDEVFNGILFALCESLYEDMQATGVYGNTFSFIMIQTACANVMLVSWLRMALRKNPSATEMPIPSAFENMRKKNENFVRMFAIPTIKLFLFIAQSQQNMWIRNGHDFQRYITMLPTLSFYGEMWYGIAALQACMHFMGPHEFLELFAEVYGLQEVLHGPEEAFETFVGEEKSVGQSFLHDLMRVVTSQLILFTDSEALEYQAVQMIMTGKYSFSSVQGNLRLYPGLSITMKSAETVIGHIGKKKPAIRNYDSDKIELRSELMNAFDVFGFAICAEDYSDSCDMYAASKAATLPKKPYKRYNFANDVCAALLCEPGLVALVKRVINGMISEKKNPKCAGLFPVCMDIVEVSSMWGFLEIYSDLVPAMQDCVQNATITSHTNQMTRILHGVENADSSKHKGHSKVESAKKRQQELLMKMKAKQRRLFDSLSASLDEVDVGSDDEADMEAESCVACRGKIETHDPEKAFDDICVYLADLKFSTYSHIVKMQRGNKEHRLYDFALSQTACPTEFSSFRPIIVSCGHKMHLSCSKEFFRLQNGCGVCPLCKKKTTCVLPCFSGFTEAIFTNDEIASKIKQEMLEDVARRMVSVLQVDLMPSEFFLSCMPPMIENALSEYEIAGRTLYDGPIKVLPATASMFRDMIAFQRAGCKAFGVHVPEMCLEDEAFSPVLRALYESPKDSIADDYCIAKKQVPMMISFLYDLWRVVNHLFKAETFCSKYGVNDTGRTFLTRFYPSDVIDKEEATPELDAALNQRDTRVLTVIDGLFTFVGGPSVDEDMETPKLDYNSFIEHAFSQTTPVNVSCPVPALPRMEFLNLPPDVSRLSIMLREYVCQHCRRSDHRNVMCLMCGRILCMRQNCPQKSVLPKHLEECAYNGAVINGKGLIIVFSGGMNAAHMACMYASKFGEVDPMFSQGQQLYLDARRVEQVLRILLTHSEHEDLVRLSTLSRE